MKIAEENKLITFDDPEDYLLNFSGWESGVRFVGDNITHVWGFKYILDPKKYNNNISECDFDKYIFSYIKAPTPFKSGDIVKNISTGEVGVYEKNELDYSEGQNEGLDFFDWADTFWTIDNKGRWGHQHISPQFLDKKRLKTRESNIEDKLKNEAIIALREYLRDYNNKVKQQYVLKTAKNYARHFYNGVYECALTTKKWNSIFG